MKNSILKYVLSVLSFIVPFLVIGFGWKFGLFQKEYKALGIYRDDVYFPFALGSMFIQAVFWTYITSNYLTKDRFSILFWNIFLLSFPLGLSYVVFMVGAKHIMSSIFEFSKLEVPFILIAHIIMSLLMASVFYQKNKK